MRMENIDPEDSKCTFSLGATLNEMRFHTCDQSWKKQFVDRTLKENAEVPLFKLLKIDNLAVYYKVQETVFIQSMHKKR